MKLKSSKIDLGIVSKRFEGSFLLIDERRGVVLCKMCDNTIDTINRFKERKDTICFYFCICWDCFERHILGTKQHYNFIQKYQPHLVDQEIFKKFNTNSKNSKNA